jgi:D-beta-D-heptose 7-phosphate kinase / D-beta-D-heptose 1-phosphate adenosyltransferase
MTTPANVVVVGDALLDRDVQGRVDRLCPDAPAPVFDWRRATERAGGAALAATLAARQGASVTLITALGDDAAGRRLRRLLDHEGVTFVDLRLAGATPEKIRLRAGGHSVLRVDRGEPSPIVGLSADAVSGALAGARAVLVSDYGHGVAAVDALRRQLQAATIPLVWDPHPRGPVPVPGATVVTPNLAELASMTPGATSPIASSLAATAAMARQSLHRWGAGAVAVTMGARGVLLVRGAGSPMAVTVAPAEGGDTCGAGDCFAAGVATALAGGAVLPEAVEQATGDAGRFVASGGAAGLGGESRPQRDPPPVGVGGGPVVVATGGCFDLLHAGHVSLLQSARALGDRLVVLLNSDRSVARLKGPDRPLQSEADRRQVLLALGCVDDVIIFDEDTPAAALEVLRPALWVKGGDYAGVDLPEADVLRRWGGQTVVVPYLRGRSTTRLVKEARRGN